MSYKKLTLFFTMLIITAIVFSSFSKTDKWNLYKQEKGVQIFYKQVDCDDVANGLFQKYVIFKLVNTTDIDIKISWKYQLWYNDKCSTCDSEDENKLVNLEVKAHSEIEGDCINKQLSVFSEFKNHPDVDKLTRFEFNNLNIKPIIR